MAPAPPGAWLVVDGAAVIIHAILARGLSRFETSNIVLRLLTLDQPQVQVEFTGISTH